MSEFGGTQIARSSLFRVVIASVCSFVTPTKPMQRLLLVSICTQRCHNYTSKKKPTQFLCFFSNLFDTAHTTTCPNFLVRALQEQARSSKWPQLPAIPSRVLQSAQLGTKDPHPTFVAATLASQKKRLRWTWQQRDAEPLDERNHALVSAQVPRFSVSCFAPTTCRGRQTRTEWLKHRRCS